MGDTPIETLEAIQRRVLWLAVRMVDEANKVDAGGVKVGGHQASSASMVSIMTALWFAHIGAEDKVAIKPHASPVYHAIKYLTGELDRSYLTTLRRKSGLQAYPSRTKDPDVSDFSTGSVGLGAVAPLFSAAVRRYVDSEFGPRPHARFIATLGDAELDEGNVWEAIADPALQGLGNVMLVVDLNRQSLDRVVPDIQSTRLKGFFDKAGWHVEEAKYGALLEAAFDRPGGQDLRRHIDEMSNEQYQSLFGLASSEIRPRFLEGADPSVKEFLADRSDDEVAHLVTNLGGHDLGVLLDRYRRCDQVTDRPSIVFAYTVKGWGLPIAGNPMNHSAFLSAQQIDDLRSSVGLVPETEWDRFVEGSAEANHCEAVGSVVNNPVPSARPQVKVPVDLAATVASTTSTQEMFGRVMARLANDEDVARRLVTSSPDVAVSTNLGGWINKVGVFSPHERPDFSAEDSLLKWKPAPTGHHVELGISEMNLFLMLGQLGLAHEHHGEMLLPVGTVYDPFVLRGLDAFVYSLYNGARFVVVGTPSGVTLAPEGGAHQSSITPSVGLELPGVDAVEPAYARAVDWLLCDGLEGLSRPEGRSLYLRLSTRTIEQGPFEEAAHRLGMEALRSDVLAGGYRLREPAERGEPLVIAASGPVMPEVLVAAELLEDEGAAVTVLDITSADRLFREWQAGKRRAASTATRAIGGGHLGSLINRNERRAPILTVHDASSHSMAWLGSVFGAPLTAVGVDDFGESGSIPELYERFGFSPHQIVNAGLLALSD